MTGIMTFAVAMDIRTTITDATGLSGLNLEYSSKNQEDQQTPLEWQKHWFFCGALRIAVNLPWVLSITQSQTFVVTSSFINNIIEEMINLIEVGEKLKQE